MLVLLMRTKANYSTSCASRMWRPGGWTTLVTSDVGESMAAIRKADEIGGLSRVSDAISRATRQTIPPHEGGKPTETHFHDTGWRLPQPPIDRVNQPNAAIPSLPKPKKSRNLFKSKGLGFLCWVGELRNPLKSILWFLCYLVLKGFGGTRERTPSEGQAAPPKPPLRTPKNWCF